MATTRKAGMRRIKAKDMPKGPYRPMRRFASEWMGGTSPLAMMARLKMYPKAY